jgi:hypothetical protein
MFARMIGAIALCCALASCSTLSKLESVKITPTQVHIAAQAFDALEVTATNYVRLPTCKAGQSFLANRCSTKAAIARLVPVIHAGRTDRDNLEAYIKTHPTGGVGASGIYDALTATVTAIKAIFGDVGVST